MSTKENSGMKRPSTKDLTCKVHNTEGSEDEKDIRKGIVSSFRRVDGLPLIETEDGRAVIVKEFQNKPQVGEQIEYLITAKHGAVMYAKRIES
ncbi:MAG: hypothetical protein ABID54_03825 [Pseudomonadota bacterium]